MGLKITQIESALITHHGNISKTAKALGVTRRAINARVAKSVTLQKARDEGREQLLDIAESQLTRKIKEGDNTAVIFYLKTQGRHRGYSQRQEIAGVEGQPVVIKAYENVSPDDWED